MPACKALLKVSDFDTSSCAVFFNLALVMSVLRMVKLFGWEGRVKETVGAKREAELKWVFRGAMFALANTVVK